jgi:hypothetical protein
MDVVDRAKPVNESMVIKNGVCEAIGRGKRVECADGEGEFEFQQIIHIMH